jgi:His/Glu/Gln/Arg/opine family amino acid ABC transporter permease subunit
MEWSVVVERLPDLARGLVQTLWICAFAAVCGLTIGALVTWTQLRGPRVLKYIAEIYVALCLGIPMLIMIYALFFVLPMYGPTLSPSVVGVCALALYYGPYFAMVMRAAILAFPVGQFEAASAIGLSGIRTVTRILLPQALPIMLPPLAGLLIGMLKDSALLAVVSVPEFMFQARQAVSETYAPLEIYITVALTYWVMSAACSAMARRLEMRLQAHVPNPT